MATLREFLRGMPLDYSAFLYIFHNFRLTCVFNLFPGDQCVDEPFSLSRKAQQAVYLYFQFRF